MTINEKKIDLKKEIIDKSSIAIGENNYAIYYALNYFFSENLNALMGKTVFDKGQNDENGKNTIGELDIIRIPKGLIITSIFGKNYRIEFDCNKIDAYEFITNEEELQKENVDENDAKVFSINIGPNVMSNVLTVSQGEEKYEYRYEINVDDKTFAYSCGEALKEPSFSAKLIDMNAKIKAKEVFEYIREYPPIDHEVSLMKKIIDYCKGSSTLRGEGVININTSDNLSEVFEYTDRIFDRLKEEKNLLNKSNMQKKELK